METLYLICNQGVGRLGGAEETIFDLAIYADNGRRHPYSDGGDYFEIYEITYDPKKADYDLWQFDRWVVINRDDRGKIISMRTDYAEADNLEAVFGDECKFRMIYG